MRRSLLVSLVLLLGACSSTSEESAENTAPTEEPEKNADNADRDPTAVSVEGQESTPAPDRVVVGRTNVTASGNRYLAGTLDLTSTPTTIDLPFEAVWVLPIADGSLIVVDESGAALAVSPDGSSSAIGSVDASVAPLAVEQGTEEGIAIVLVPNTSGVDSDLPDASTVEADGVMAWYDGATDRVPHGALGDTTESTRLVIQRRQVGDPMDDAGDEIVASDRIVVDLEADPSSPVFEGLSPLLGDVDGDDVVDILTTISDTDTGARLAVFNINGELVAESDPIGQGNRWRHQIAVAPTNPNGGGVNEVIEVETPHIGGLLQFRAFGDGDLPVQFQTGTFQSHVLGSRNLDGAVVFDADGDRSPEVVVPTQGRDALAIVDSEPTDDGPLLIDLAGATVSSNLALGETEDSLRFAVALSDGRLLVW